MTTPADAMAQEAAALRATAAAMHVVSLADVPMRAVQWLWRDYLPIGKVVVVDGFPGQGKSTLALDIAARLSAGRAMPDGSAGKDAADTLILTYEDDASDTLRPRLEAARADLTRVHHVAGVSYNGDDLLLPPSLPKDLAPLEQTIAERPAVRLVIVDPLMAALGGEVDSHKDQSVRGVLARLARIAVEAEVCFLVIRHVRKAPGSNAITAGGGSIGISGQARVVLLVDRHPEDPAAAVLAVSKSNVGRIPSSLVFRKVSALLEREDGPPIETSRLEWAGSAGLTADELLSARDDNGAGDTRDVADWLRDVLKAPNGTDRKTVMRSAGDCGFSERTVDRAAKRLNVVRERSGFGAECRAIWRLPEAADAPVPTHSRQDAPRTAGGGSGETTTGEARPFGCPSCDRRFHLDPSAPDDPRCFLCRRAEAAA